MSDKTKYHITKHEEGWGVKKEGASRASAVEKTKQDAINRAKEIAINNGNASIIIHKKDGKFQEERTYPRDKDPFPPRG